jgi:hypothetical protein
MTHGLRAVRGLLDDAAITAVAREVALELAVGVAWFAAAGFVFNRIAERSRHDGSIEFGS